MEGEASLPQPPEQHIERGLIPAPEQGNESAKAELKRVLETTRPYFERSLKEFEGSNYVQHTLRSPEIKIANPEHFKELTGDEEPAGLRRMIEERGLVDTVLIPLGVFNYIPNGDRRTLEYRSKTKGNNFAIDIDGDDITVTGDASVEEITGALQYLFDANGEPIIRRDRYSIDGYGDPDVGNLDRNGNPKGEVPSGDALRSLMQKTIE